jgi:hypothetical protein
MENNIIRMIASLVIITGVTTVSGMWSRSMSKPTVLKQKVVKVDKTKTWDLYAYHSHGVI